MKLCYAIQVNIHLLLTHTTAVKATVYITWLKITTALLRAQLRIINKFMWIWERVTYFIKENFRQRVEIFRARKNDKSNWRKSLNRFKEVTGFTGVLGCPWCIIQFAVLYSYSKEGNAVSTTLLLSNSAFDFFRDSQLVPLISNRTLLSNQWCNYVAILYFSTHKFHHILIYWSTTGWFVFYKTESGKWN